MRGPEPSLSDRRVRIERALEHDLSHVRGHYAHDQKEVGVRRLGRHVELGRDRARDLDLLRHGRREEGDALAEPVVGHAAPAGDGCPAQALVGRAQIELGPARARERPFLLVPLDELLTGVADLQHDLRLLLPSRVFALQEVAEELLLKGHTVVRVEVSPVLDAVHLEPLLLRRRAHESLEVAPGMQALPAPVGRREERHRDPRPVGHARAPVLVAGERILPAVLVEIAAVAAELLLGQGRQPGDPVAVHPAPEPLGAATVLDPDDLRGEPRLPERTEDAAVVTEITVVVGRALPDADGGQVRWLECGDLPLVHRVVGDAVEPDLAGAPGLRGRPLDAMREVLRLAG